MPADPLRSRVAAKKACEAASAIGCQAQSMMVTKTSTGTTPAQNNALFQENCDKGMLVACAMLGQSLIEGSGGTVDRAKGVALLRKACDGGRSVGVRGAARS